MRNWRIFCQSPTGQTRVQMSRDCGCALDLCHVANRVQRRCGRHWGTANVRSAMCGRNCHQIRETKYATQRSRKMSLYWILLSWILPKDINSANLANLAPDFNSPLNHWELMTLCPYFSLLSCELTIYYYDTFLFLTHPLMFWHLPSLKSDV